MTAKWSCRGLLGIFTDGFEKVVTEVHSISWFNMTVFFDNMIITQFDSVTNCPFMVIIFNNSQMFFLLVFNN